MRTSLSLLTLAALLAGPASGAAPSSHHREAFMHHCCPIVELRQYTLHPGKRDTLVTLFENEFIESQEATGMRVAAQFLDGDDANRFVWVRGFDSMEQRAQALTSFYTGPVWQAHRNAANATMVDSDNVLLLRPAFPGSGFALDTRARPARGAVPEGRRVVAASIHYFDTRTPAAEVEAFGRGIAHAATQAGARVLAQYVSEKSTNTFPRLPVRENENVFVWFAAFESDAAYRAWRSALAGHPRWRDLGAQQRPPETLMLHPTARSLVR